MGCEYYYIGDDDADFIRFSETDDEFGCLCTFPYNDQEKLSPERMASLAMLGAAFILEMRGELTTPIFLPDSLPKWVIEGIKALTMK